MSWEVTGNLSFFSTFSPWRSFDSWVPLGMVELLKGVAIRRGKEGVAAG